MTKQDDGGGIKRYTTFVPLGATGQDVRQVACGELVMYADHAADRAAKQAEIDRLREQLSMAGDKREEDAAAHMKEVEWWHKIAANVLTMIVTAIQGDVLSPAFGERLSDMLRTELAAHDDGEGDK